MVSTPTAPPDQRPPGHGLRPSIRQRDLLAWLDARREPGRPERWSTVADYYGTARPSSGVRTSTRTALCGLHAAGLLELSWSPTFAPMTTLPERLSHENLFVVRRRLETGDRWRGEQTRRHALGQQHRLRAAIGRGDQRAAREAVEQLCSLWGLERPLPRAGTPAPAQARSLWLTALALADRSLPTSQPWPHALPGPVGRSTSELVTG